MPTVWSRAYATQTWTSWSANYVVSSNSTTWDRPTADWVVTDAWGNWNYMWATGSQTVIRNPIPVQTMNDVAWTHYPVVDADDLTWRNWTTVGTVSAINYGWDAWNTHYEETEEARAERENQARIREAQRAQQAAEWADRRRRTDEERRIAEVRAKELLLLHLDEQQRADVLANGWFEVISNTGQRWRIRTSHISGNVDLMPEDPSDNRRLASYCAHPPDTAAEILPPSDHHMAQKLTLETDEAAFLKVANVHYLDRERAHRRPAPDPTRRGLVIPA